MKIDKTMESIWFSHGLIVEHMDGHYNIPKRELIIYSDKRLPQILQYLRQLFYDDLVSIKLTWYRN